MKIITLQGGLWQTPRSSCGATVMKDAWKKQAQRYLVRTRMLVKALNVSTEWDERQSNQFVTLKNDAHGDISARSINFSAKDCFISFAGIS
jgi:hypothetical protein